MVNEQLVNYFRASKVKGYNDEQIKEFLLREGHSAAVIEEAANAVNGVPIQKSQPIPIPIPPSSAILPPKSPYRKKAIIVTIIIVLVCFAVLAGLYMSANKNSGLNLDFWNSKNSAGDSTGLNSKNNAHSSNKTADLIPTINSSNGTIEINPNSGGSTHNTNSNAASGISNNITSNFTSNSNNTSSNTSNATNKTTTNITWSGGSSGGGGGSRRSGSADSEPSPSCTDSAQNGDETGIDCGGSCPACIILTANLTVNYTVGGNAVGNASDLNLSTNCSINASSDYEYLFLNWSSSGNCSVNDATSNETTVQVNSGWCYVQANFVYNMTANLTVNRTLGGIASGNASYFVVPANKTISAVADFGYYFQDWSSEGDCSVNDATNNETTVQVNSGWCYVQANFVLYLTSNLTVNYTVGGIAIGNETNFTVPANKSINATASTNYSFSNWSVSGNCTVASGTSSSTTVQVNSGGCYVQANFIATDISITSYNINHTNTNVSMIPACWIEKVKQDLHIAYSHTSHGSQLYSGIQALEAYNSTYGIAPVANTGELHFEDYYGYGPNSGFGTGGCDDLSICDGVSGGILNPTREFLNSSEGQEINIIMWSWCSIAGHDILEYLTNMQTLIVEYENGSSAHPTPVKFVFITGHAEGDGEGDSSDSRNILIRNFVNNQSANAFCKTHQCILFDFSDMENYDPDNNYFLDRYVTDALNYDAGNWGTDYLARHPVGLNANLTNIMPSYDCAHSKSPDGAYLNCALKGQASWWLFAKLAGWNGDTSHACS